MSTNQVEVMAVEQLDDHALLDLVEQGLAMLGGRPLSGAVEDAALAESVERLHRVETVVVGEKLRRVAAVDARGVWRSEGARSTADLLARRLRLTRGEARAQAETAVGLEELPETAAAVRAGTIGLGQAQVAVQTAKELRPDVREELDRLVAGDGGGLDPPAAAGAGGRVDAHGGPGGVGRAGAPRVGEPAGVGHFGRLGRVRVCGGQVGPGRHRDADGGVGSVGAQNRPR